MNVLIIGGTGTVGRHVIPLLLARNVRVSVMTRTSAGAATLPRGARAEIGDLNRSYTLHGAFDAIDAVVLITAHSITETGQGLAAVNAALAAHVRRIVYLSAAACAGAMRIPHVASKAPIEHALITARADYTILRAHNFFQNDLLVDEEIASGSYPLPIGGNGISRIDVCDVADAIVNAALKSGHERRLYTLGTSDTFTGEATAAKYERYLRRPVRYAGDNLDTWEHGTGAPMPKWQRDDFRIMYRHYQDHGMKMEKAELVEQERILGHDPRRFDDFAAAAARAWRNDGVAQQLCGA
ncbi:MAG TPA: NAD(P)H-binding protein [Thermoanaerobaculia bacterium]